MGRIKPDTFTLYLDDAGNVSTQTLKCNTTYAITPLDPLGAPSLPLGRPFTCSGPQRPTTFKSDLSLSFALVSDPDAWRAAFDGAGTTVVLWFDLGPGGANGRDYVTIDLRRATVSAALIEAKAAAANVVTDSLVFISALFNAARFALTGGPRSFRKKQEPQAALVSGKIENE